MPKKAKAKRFKRLSQIRKMVLWTSLFFGISAIGLNIALQGLMPQLANYETSIEQYLSKEMGASVDISSLSSRWRWGLPVFDVENVLIKNESGEEIAKINHISFGTSLWQSLVQWQWQPGFITLSDAALKVDETDINAFPYMLFSLHGLKKGGDIAKSHQVLDWLLKQKNILVKNISLDVRLANHHYLPISKLNLSMVNQGHKHHIQLDFNLNQLTQSKLTLVANLQGEQSQDLKGSIYFKGNRIVLGQWLNAHLKKPYQINSGTINVQGFAMITNGLLTKVNSTFSANNISLENTKTHQQILMQRLNSQILLAISNEKTHLLLKRLSFRMGNKVLKALRFDYTQKGIDKHFSMNKMSLALLHKISAPFVKEIPNLAKHYQNLDKLSGDLKDISVQLKNNHLDILSAKVKNLSFTTLKPKLTINGLNFDTSVKDNVFSWHFNSGLTYVNARDYLNKPTYLSEIKGGLHLSLANNNRLCWHDLTITSPFLSLGGQGCLDNLGEKDKQHLDTKFDFLLKRAEKLTPLLPKAYFKPKLYDFLTHAFIFIPKVKGKILSHGLLKDFPYKDKSKGQFDVSAQIVDASIQYHKDWPIMVAYDAKLHAYQDKIDIDVLKGKSRKVKVKDTKVFIQDIGEKTALIVNGTIDTTGQKATDFVQHSVLNKHLGFVDTWQLQGPIHLEFKDYLGLNPKANEDKLEGRLFFNNNTVYLHAEPGVSLSEMKGEIPFNLHGVDKSQINGKLWQKDIKLFLESDKAYPHTLTILVNGQIECQKALDALKIDAPFIQGTLPLNLKITRNPVDKINIFNDEINLKNLAIDLPKPLNKKMGVSEKLKLSGKIKDGKLLNLEAAIDKRSDASYERDKPLMINAKDLALDDWSVSLKPLFKSLKLKSWAKGDKASDTFKIKTTGVMVGPYKTKPLLITGEQNKKDLSFYLKSKTTQGELIFPYQQNAKPDINLTKLYLLSGKSKSNKTAKTKSLPSLKLLIQSLRLDDLNLGRLQFVSDSHEKDGKINDLSLTLPGSRLKLNGYWVSQQGNTQTFVSGYIQSQNIVDTFKALQLEPVMSSKNALVKFNFSWPSMPLNLSLGKVSGQMALEIHKGLITHLSKEAEEKVGIGKLLNVLSLQTIPRRLTLDFSDLNKGLPFDTIEASLRANKGALNVEKAEIEGPIASARVEGDLSLIDKDYDLKVYLNPHITSSLPVVATIAGGPIAGIATWFVGKIVSQGMKKSKAYGYQISGAWDTPTLTQIKA